MSVNLNVSPYFDDFDPNKNFQRILFKPGVGVQARELTQSQTILQDQISKFGSSIYQQNTPVSGGNITISSCYYLKLKLVYNGSEITASDFLNKTIVDSTGKIQAKVIQTAEKVMNGTTVIENPVLYIQYITNESFPFTDNQQIFTLENELLTVYTFGNSLSNVSTGTALVSYISSGVFYIVTDYNISNNITNKIGNFVSVQEQTIISSKYTSNANLSIGLTVVDSIYTYNDDSSLLDPAIGEYNFQGPGADRYTVKLLLSSYTLGNEPINFIKLVELQQGKIIKQISTQYSNIDTYFAQRTYDTNGDYVVNDFKIIPVKNSLDSSKYDLKISKGVAYVKGYRIEQQSEIIKTGNRARTTQSHLNKSVNTNYGSYLFVDTVKGSNTYSFDFTSLPSIDLHCVSSSNIDLNNYSSTLVGTATLRNLDYDFASNPSDSTTYTYKAYISDVSTKKITSTVQSATSNTITFYNSNLFSSSNNAYTNVILSIDSGVTRGETKKVISYDGTTKTVTLDSNLSLIPSFATIVSLNFKIKDIETVVKIDSSNNIIASANIAAAGKTGTLSTGDTLLYDSTKPELIFNIGDSYVNSVINSSYLSKKIYKNQIFTNSSGLNTAVSLTLSVNPTDTSIFDFSISDFSNFIVTVKDRGLNTTFNNGDILTFDNIIRTIVVSADNQTLTLKLNDITSSFTADIITNVNIKNADSSAVLKTKKKVIASNTVVSLTGPDYNDGNTFVDLTNGQVYINNSGLVGVNKPQTLLISDAISVKIINTKSPQVQPTVAMLSNPNYDVTSWFTFDNGQRDSYYDYATIKAKIGFPYPQGNLLVLVNYYDHDNGGDGYFSVMSYLSPQSISPEDYSFIPSYTSKTSGITYNLKDCLDFRPSRINANPVFSFESYSGILLPYSYINFNCDYTFYLPRKDILTLDKEGNFNLIEGTSAQNPVFPENKNSLLLSEISLDAYTSFLPGEYTNINSAPSLSIKNVQNKRWTMEDITGLQNRINDLEYYTALNFLEQQSLNSQVPDSLGINRFKNGILVDDFSSFSSSDINNPEYSVSINPRTKQLTAKQIVTNLPLTDPEINNKLNNKIFQTTDYFISDIDGKKIFSLPFTSNILIKQLTASNTININPLNTQIYAGSLNLNPPVDNWVDIERTPDPLTNSVQANGLNPLEYGDWKAVIGTSVAKNTTQITQQLNNLNQNNNNFNTSLSTFGTTSASSVLYGLAVPDYYTINNNYVTNTSVAPYIRHQKLLIQASGMKPLTEISAWFDGTKVNSYIKNPDTVLLTNVVGTFEKNGVIGYTTDTAGTVFVPIGVIVSVTTTINSGITSVKLQITGNFNTSYKDFKNPIIVGTFDYNGNYNSTAPIKASGITTNTSTANPITVKTSGNIVSVGGSFQDYQGSSVKFYNVNPTYNGFASYYGIWSSQVNDAGGTPGNYYSTMPTSVFQFNLPTADTYYIQYSIDDYIQGDIVVTEIATNTPVFTQHLYTDVNNPDDPNNWNPNPLTEIKSFTITNPGFYTISFSNFKHWANGDESFDAFLAVAIAGKDPHAVGTQSGWLQAGKRDLKTDAIVYFNTRNLNGNGLPPVSTDTQIELPGGGFYYTGVTSINLDGLASQEDNYYQDCWINITTYYVYLLSNVGNDNTQQVRMSRQTHTRRIESYTGSTRQCTFSPGITVSLGGNVLIGGFDISSTYSFNGKSGSLYNNQFNLNTYNDTSNLITDDKGNFVGIFDIPESTFHTGERILRLDNRTNDTDITSVTTFAQATFTAKGLISKVNEINPSVSVDPSSYIFTSSYYRQYTNNNLVATTIQSSNSFDPLAQTFIIDKNNYPVGVFLSSIDLFFITKPILDAGNYVKISLVGTTNGLPNGTILNYSQVTVNNNKIQTGTLNSTLVQNATNFKFNAPVYLQSNVLYAIIIESNSQDYKLAIAITNENDKVTDTTKKVIYASGVGSLLESQNSLTWSPDFSKFLMMNINKCVFDISAMPSINFSVDKNLPTSKNTMDQLQAVQSGNAVYADNYPINLLSDAFNITTNDMIPNDSLTAIDYSYISTLNSNNSYTDEITIQPGKNACPTPEDIYLSDGKGERVIQKNVPGSFILKAKLSSDLQDISPILSDDGLSVFNINWNINNLQLSNTNVNIINGGTNLSAVSISVSPPDIYGGTQAYATANVSSGTIDFIRFTNAGSGYLNPPTLSFSGTNTNTIDITISSEFSPNGGNAACKYFTKKVILAPGNDSKDLRVFFNAYKPLHTNIYVFCKLLSSTDNSTFENNDWNLLTLVGDNSNNYSKTRDDLYEYEYAPGTGGIADNFITYQGKDPLTGDPTQLFDSFIQFAIKIVLTTEDKTTVPYLTNLRVLALPSGTGY